MKKSGFTLAEVLVAMGLIGVVAAMTIPTFVMNGRQQANDAKYLSTIADLENAFGSMITKEAVDGFSETKFYGSMTKANIEKYLKVTNEKTSNSGFYGTASPFKYKQCKETLTVSPSSILELKNGSYFIIVSKTKGYIDVNGKTKPNCLNRDLYEVKLDDNGLFDRQNEDK